jgi:hypothetical protein
MKKLGIFISFVFSFLWASIYWLGEQNRWQTDWLASLNLSKPWVYRQLVPILVRGLQGFFIPTDIGTVLIVSLSGVGFYLALRNLLVRVYEKSLFIETFSILSFIFGLAMFGSCRTPYDLSTALFFSLSYLLIIKNDDNFLWVFPLAVLNRETAFLLILFHFIYHGRSWRTLYFGTVFVSIQIVLRLVFLDNIGTSVWITPWQNILEFVHNPLRTLEQFSIITIILFGIFWSWKSHEQRLKVGFLTISSLCLLMYLVVGQAFEVRVLWEVYPLVCVLSIPTLKEIYYEMQGYSKDGLSNRNKSEQNQDANLVT